MIASANFLAVRLSQVSFARIKMHTKKRLHTLKLTFLFSLHFLMVALLEKIPQVHVVAKTRKRFQRSFYPCVQHSPDDDAMNLDDIIAERMT